MDNSIKERPILFNAQMVQAILEGRKTQTRRIVKHSGNCIIIAKGTNAHVLDKAKTWHLSPYGKVGDRLWVRETFGYYLQAPSDDHDKAKIIYKADGYPQLQYGEKWKPSIFMPKWASRITLEITSVRVERLNDISENDAKAEGIKDGGCIDCGESEFVCKCANPQPSYVDAFAGLWQLINGSNSWFLNPWVWVVEFKKIEI